jgi:hypothetical protein
MCRALGGRWEISLANDKQTWEPWIVDPSGTRHPMFVLLVEELTEWGEDSSIDGLVTARIAAARRSQARRSTPGGPQHHR